MKITLNKSFASNSPVDEFDVRQIKKALNRLGYYSPFAATGITGIPDQAMFGALRAFQADQRLAPTGRARPGDETVQALSNAAGQKTSGQYIWRTVGDSKVRSSHRALNGKIRHFGQSPDPGEEINCRCWAEIIPNDLCDKEINNLAEAQKRVKDLSKKLNNLLLRLDELVEEGNKLIENARKALGAQIVAYILGLPLDRLGALAELLRRYFGNIINDELLQAADDFMKKLWAVKRKAQHVRDQIAIIFDQLEKAARELEEANKRMEECEKGRKKL